MQFAFPINQLPFWLLVGIGLAGCCFLALRAMERNRDSRLHQFIEAGLASRLLPGYDAAVRRPLVWLSIFGVVFLLLTLAQPHWGESWVDLERGSRDILVLLDISESMNATDILPTRLERAKSKIEAMLEMVPGDRVGLVAFAGEAALLSPLTHDHDYFKSILQTTDTDSLNVMGTDIAEALRIAGEVFEEDARITGDSSRAHRAIWLISDGEQISGDAVSQAVLAGKDAGIFVLGIGSEQGTVIEFPQWMLRYRNLPADKRHHISRLDESTLTQIALAGDGVYVRTTPTGDDIRYIHEEMEHLTVRTVEGELRYSLVNRYRWPLALAMLCFAAEGFWFSIMPWLRYRRMQTDSMDSKESLHA